MPKFDPPPIKTVGSSPERNPFSYYPPPYTNPTITQQIWKGVVVIQDLEK